MSDFGWQETQSFRIDHFSAAGEAVHAVDVPDGVGKYLELAWNGERAVACGAEVCVTWPTLGAEPELIRLSEKTPEGPWQPFLPEGEDELWLFDDNRSRLLKLPLPRE